MVIFLLSDYSVYLQLYLHFFLFDTISRLFICLAIHTDKYIYSVLCLQSSVSNINCNRPVLVVMGREATLDWGLGEQILMFVLIQCVTTGRSLHLHVLLPFLFALTYSEAGIASFLVSLCSPWSVFPPVLSSWSRTRGLRALGWRFCWKWQTGGWAGQARGSNHNGSIRHL